MRHAFMLQLGASASTRAYVSTYDDGSRSRRMCLTTPHTTPRPHNHLSPPQPTPNQLFDQDWHDKYELLPSLETIPCRNDRALDAYLVRVDPARAPHRHHIDQSNGLLLLPDAAGWTHPTARALADRLAVLCSAVVMMPDLGRGAPSWDAPASADGFDTWLSGMPPARVTADARECAVHLRADHRVQRLGLVGVGLGGTLVLREASSEAALMAAVAIALCPMPTVPVELKLKVPTLCIFGSDGEAAAEEARRQLAAAAAPLAETPVRVVDAPMVATTAPKATAAPQKVPSISSLRRLKVAEVRERLRELGQPEDGLKAELVERLRGALVVSASGADIDGRPQSVQGSQAPRGGGDGGRVGEHVVLALSGTEELSSMWSGTVESCVTDVSVSGASDALLIAEAFLSAHLVSGR